MLNIQGTRELWVIRKHAPLDIGSHRPQFKAFQSTHPIFLRSCLGDNLWLPLMHGGPHSSIDISTILLLCQTRYLITSTVDAQKTSERRQYLCRSSPQLRRFPDLAVHLRTKYVNKRISHTGHVWLISPWHRCGPLDNWNPHQEYLWWIWDTFKSFNSYTSIPLSLSM